MTRYDADTLKDGRTAQKPATLELNGNHIEATHHITNERDTLLHLYLADRSDGIDITVPLESDKPAYARSERGRGALGLAEDVEADKRLVADGGFGIGEVDVGDKVIVRFRGAKYDPWTVESVDGEDVEISRRGFTRSLTRYNLAAFEPRPTVDGDDPPVNTGVCAMDGCDKRLEDCEFPVQGYCGPVHSQRDQYDGDFALDTADVAGFPPGVGGQ